MDNAKDIDVIIPMHNLIQYSNNYSKTWGSLSQYCSDNSALNDVDAIGNFTDKSIFFNLNKK